MSAHWGVADQQILLPLLASSGQLPTGKHQGRVLGDNVVLVRRAVTAAPKDINILLELLDCNNPATLFEITPTRASTEVCKVLTKVVSAEISDALSTETAATLQTGGFYTPFTFGAMNKLCLSRGSNFLYLFKGYHFFVISQKIMTTV